jgi:hypothetical protein
MCIQDFLGFEPSYFPIVHVAEARRPFAFQRNLLFVELEEWYETTFLYFTG